MLTNYIFEDQLIFILKSLSFIYDFNIYFDKEKLPIFPV